MQLLLEEQRKDSMLVPVLTLMHTPFSLAKKNLVPPLGHPEDSYSVTQWGPLPGSTYGSVEFSALVRNIDGIPYKKWVASIKVPTTTSARDIETHGTVTCVSTPSCKACIRCSNSENDGGHEQQSCDWAHRCVLERNAQWWPFIGISLSKPA